MRHPPSLCRSVPYGQAITVVCMRIRCEINNESEPFSKLGIWYRLYLFGIYHTIGYKEGKMQRIIAERYIRYSTKGGLSPASATTLPRLDTKIGNSIASRYNFTGNGHATAK